MIDTVLLFQFPTTLIGVVTRIIGILLVNSAARILRMISNHIN